MSILETSGPVYAVQREKIYMSQHLSSLNHILILTLSHSQCIL